MTVMLRSENLFLRPLSSKELCSKGRNCGHHGTSKSIKHSNWFAHLRHRVHPVVFLLGSAIRVRQNIFGQGYSTCKDLLFITVMGAMTKIECSPPQQDSKWHWFTNTTVSARFCVRIFSIFLASSWVTPNKAPWH